MLWVLFQGPKELLSSSELPLEELPVAIPNFQVICEQ